MYNELAARLVYAQHITCGAYLDRGPPVFFYHGSRACLCQDCEYFSHEIVLIYLVIKHVGLYSQYMVDYGDSLSENSGDAGNNFQLCLTTSMMGVNETGKTVNACGTIAHFPRRSACCASGMPPTFSTIERRNALGSGLKGRRSLCLFCYCAAVFAYSVTTQLSLLILLPRGCLGRPSAALLARFHVFPSIPRSARQQWFFKFDDYNVLLRPSLRVTQKITRASDSVVFATHQYSAWRPRRG